MNQEQHNLNESKKKKKSRGIKVHYIRQFIKEPEEWCNIRMLLVN
jgi:hypothetical protein